MVFAVVLSGGTGSRMGLDIPKQYFKVNDIPIIMYCLQTFFYNSYIDKIIIAISDEWREFMKPYLVKIGSQKECLFVKSGKTRQLSVFNSLKLIEQVGGKKEDLVVIHDAARPLVSRELIESCLVGCESADGILPVIPVKDTIYQSRDGKQISALMNRNELWAGQAPEAFRFGKYLDIHKKMSLDELMRINGSTEIAFKGGLKCDMIQGDSMNFKITTLEDLKTFENIIKCRQNI